MKLLLRPFTRRWLLTSLLVVAATIVLVRLGIWQLDRLAARRAFNSRVTSQVSQPVLNLNEAVSLAGELNLEALPAMEYRQVVASGVYDFSQEIALRNQVWHDQYGVHLLTPLRIKDSDLTVMVDRGWIPGSDFYAGESAGEWPQFAEPGLVTVTGVIRQQQIKPDFGRISDPTPVPGQGRLVAWNLSNLEQMQRQLPYPILSVYIQQSPDPVWTGMPYRREPNLELTEGPHLGYAIQWFTFAGILFLGYPFFIHRDEQRSHKEQANNKIDKSNTLEIHAHG